MAKKRAAAAAEPPPRINPSALSIDDLALLLTKAGGRPIAAAKIREDLAAGAPANADGTLHLVHYAAWLAAQSD
jgi:hypothetical protein